MRLLQAMTPQFLSQKRRSTSRGLMLGILAALALAAAQPVAGLYDVNQMEMGGGLELRPDGRFRYALEYGAVSEESGGKWTLDAGAVLLTTDPMPQTEECDRGFASACFRRTPLAIEGENLILIRWDARIVLKPVQPRPR
jgi:hypothetical protein